MQTQTDAQEPNTETWKKKALFHSEHIRLPPHKTTGKENILLRKEYY